MKRIALTALVALVLVGGNAAARDAVGSSFGTLMTARSLGQGVGDLGFGIGLGDWSTSFVGSFTYGLSEASDGRIKFGLAEPDGGDTKITFGADYKWQFWNYSQETNHPFDMAVGGLFEYGDWDVLSVLQLGGFLIGSYPVHLNSGGTITPYARLTARLESISLDLPYNSGDDSESNLEVGLSGGAQWEVNSDISLYGEFQLDGNDGVFFGIDFNVM